MCKSILYKSWLKKPSHYTYWRKNISMLLLLKSILYTYSLTSICITHTGAKPFLCYIGKRGFSQHGHLKVNALIHIGETPYNYNYCAKAYSTKGYFKHHFNMHKREKTYQCDIWMIASYILKSWNELKNYKYIPIFMYYNFF